MDSYIKVQNIYGYKDIIYTKFLLRIGSGTVIWGKLQATSNTLQKSLFLL